MADAKSDWMAGGLLIGAAFLIGVGVPIGLWFGLYAPTVEERERKEAQLQALEAQMQVLVARQQVVRGLEEDGDEMVKRLEDLEAPYHVATPRMNDVPDARSILNTLSEHHNLLVPDEFARETTEVVRPGSRRIEWPNGLRATELEINASGTFHDFARFVMDMENREDMVVIPNTMTMLGNSTA
jgi:Tfp pilus assembly protein PilO